MGSAIAIAALMAPAQAASLTDWNFDPNTNHLEVTVKDGTTPRYFLMAQPARIVMDLPGTSIAGVKTQANYGGAVRQIRVSQFQPGMTRIVLELSPGVTLASGQVNLQKMGDATRWMLKPLLAESIATPGQSIGQSTPTIASVPAPIAPRSIVATPAAASPTAAIVPPALSQNPVSVPPLSPDLPQSPPATPAPVPAAIAAAKPETPTAAIVPPALPSNPVSVPPLSADLPKLPSVDSAPVPLAIAPPKPETPTAAIVPPALPLNLVSVPPLSPEVRQSPPLPSAPVPPAIAVTALPAPAAIVPPLPPVPTTPANLEPLQPLTPPAATTALRAVPNPAPLFPTAAAPASLEIPTTLFTVQPTPLIAVPAVQKTNFSPAAPAAGSSADLVPTTAQTLQAPENNRLATLPSAQVTVPPLQSPAPAVLPQTPSTVSGSDLPPQPAIAPVMPAPPQSEVIEFGQPLPAAPTLRSSGLAAGTLLSLRYPGAASLKLRTGTPHQEVLLLQSELRDSEGNLIAPKDSKVIGRFETTKAGSRFIAQAIALQGRSLPLEAQSEVLSGNLKVSDRTLAVNSGLGAIAGGIIGGFSGAGLAGGAATGAAVTLLTSPKPATVQPGQIVQVRLLQDLR